MGGAREDASGRVSLMPHTPEPEGGPHPSHRRGTPPTSADETALAPTPCPTGSAATRSPSRQALDLLGREALVAQRAGQAWEGLDRGLIPGKMRILWPLGLFGLGFPDTLLVFYK